MNPIDGDALALKVNELGATAFINNPEAKALFTQAMHYINQAPAIDAVKVVRCENCIHAEKISKHAELSNKSSLRHCKVYRGEETRNVWHKYIKEYRDYSLVELDGFCSDGIEKEDEKP